MKKWRPLNSKEQKAKGCHYCADSKDGRYCPFKKCPYFDRDKKQ